MGRAMSNNYDAIVIGGGHNGLVSAAYLARWTPLGRHIFAVGGNERAAALSGIRINRVKLFVYMFSGFCA